MSWFRGRCGARTVAHADTRPVRGGTEWIAGESTGRSRALPREVGTWSIRGAVAEAILRSGVLVAAQPRDRSVRSEKDKAVSG